jgi:hypothetical protein
MRIKLRKRKIYGIRFYELKVITTYSRKTITTRRFIFGCIKMQNKS